MKAAVFWEKRNNLWTLSSHAQLSRQRLLAQKIQKNLCS